VIGFSFLSPSLALFSLSPCKHPFPRVYFRSPRYQRRGFLKYLISFVLRRCHAMLNALVFLGSYASYLRPKICRLDELGVPT